MVAGYTSMHGFCSNLNDFGVNTILAQLLCSFSQGKEGITAFAWATINKQYFHPFHC